MKQWADYYGRPVHVGEFGAYKTFMDVNSRARFLAAFRSTLDELALSWAMWEWKAGFSYWDTTVNQPSPGVRDAIFPKPVLSCTGPGQFGFDSAVGKTWRIDRATLLHSPIAWSSIATQTLAQPRLTYSDPLPTNAAAFYRVEWIK